jgi:hypothetical protein
MSALVTLLALPNDRKASQERELAAAQAAE